MFLGKYNSFVGTVNGRLTALSQTLPEKLALALDDKTLLYRFTIEDPDTWTKPWTAEYTWPATDELLYEYACHEGNYAMGNILRGARLKEVNDAKKTSKQQ